MSICLANSESNLATNKYNYVRLLPTVETYTGLKHWSKGAHYTPRTFTCIIHTFRVIIHTAVSFYSVKCSTCKFISNFLFTIRPTTFSSSQFGIINLNHYDLSDKTVIYIGSKHIQRVVLDVYARFQDSW